MIIDPEECGGPTKVILGSDVGSRPQMKGGLMRDEMGNPPGTIYFLTNPIEWIKNKFFGKNSENVVPEPIPENVPEISPEELFKESIANKLDEVFNCNHKTFFRHTQFPFLRFDNCKDPKEIFIHNKFRFTRYRNEYKVEIYDPTEPELVELVYYIELSDIKFNGEEQIYSKYYRGIWDEEFLETLDELVSIKKAERIVAAEKIEKERVQAEIDRKLAEQIKQERIRKMFTKEVVE